MGGVARDIAVGFSTGGLSEVAKAAGQNPRKAGYIANPLNAALYDATRGEDAITKRGGVIDTASGNRARREAGEQLNETQKRANEQAAALAGERSEQERQAGLIRNRDAARRRFRALRMGSGGRASTILTSSLGLSGSADTAQKTLLGQ